MLRLLRRSLSILLLLASAHALRAQDDSDVAFFESKIRPVLVEHCLECHGDTDEISGGLRLDSLQGWATGGASGPAIVPGQPDDSLLMRAINYDDPELQMPPDARLPEAVIHDFREWIERGAVDPRNRDQAEATPPKAIDIHAGRNHWSYQLPQQHRVPAVRQQDWPYNEIDVFILAGLEQAGLKPAGDADRSTLVRRVYFDLTGLPPTIQQIDEFLEDPRPDAYERLVDRLLTSPHFGERWARHWLDVVRFGESMTLRGLVFPNAWRYRDYVIESFNQDRPYDQMVREHIAGDLLTADDLGERQRRLIATGFLAFGNWNLEEQDKAQLRMDVVDEQLDALGRAFLAQTLSCARCHDHKFDPIPTTDYYAMAGILRNTKSMEHANVSAWIEIPLPLPPDEQAVFQQHEAAIAELNKRISEKKQASTNPEVADDELKQLEIELKKLTAIIRQRPLAMSVSEESNIEEARVHIRGTVHNLGAEVPRGFLQVANYDEPPAFSPGQSGRRELADWLAGSRNPLTARVFVNRVWHWLFGAGLVRSTDNFGTTGELPSHPELLDHLAVRFVEEGWSTKTLIRNIVLSHTYRQSSIADARSEQLDPENRLLSRAHRRRQDVECLRDAMLSVSDRLDLRMGGSTIQAGTTEDYQYQHAEDRRSVYMPVLRNALPDIFEVFDFADPSVGTGARNSSIVAPQALYLLNHPFVRDQARSAALRILAEPLENEHQRIVLAFRRILGRLPTDSEAQIALKYLNAAADKRDEAWTDLVHSLFGSLDFRYLH